MKISFQPPIAFLKGAVAAPIFKDNMLSAVAASLDEASQGVLRATAQGIAFKAKSGQLLFAPSTQKDISLLIGLGAGEQKALSLCEAEKWAGETFYALQTQLKEKTVTISLSDMIFDGFCDATAAAHMGIAMMLKGWRFDQYRTQLKAEDCHTFDEVIFVIDNVTKAEEKFQALLPIVDGVFLTRTVVSEPPNVIFPESLAAVAKTLENDGVKVTILDVAAMSKLGMGALLGVGQGSAKESRMVIMEWQGAAKAEQPVAFVGKGVTFDTGGISIKPSANMDEMKYDMAGSGVVIGLMKTLAQRKAKVNAVGVVALVENMPSGSAQRPGDIVTTMSGQTVEVLNTDAEGRLILADALWYTQLNFKPKFIVDLATLTGAIVVCLGESFAGLFSNDDELSEKLLSASKRTGEKLWRLPLDDDFDAEVDSEVADLKNIGSGRGAGSSIAAHFLQRFVNKTPWAHLDIAGTAWSKKNLPLSFKGATSFGVRLLNQLVKDHYEAK